MNLSLILYIYHFEWQSQIISLAQFEYFSKMKQISIEDNPYPFEGHPFQGSFLEGDMQADHTGASELSLTSVPLNSLQRLLLPLPLHLQQLILHLSCPFFPAIRQPYHSNP